MRNFLMYEVSKSLTVFTLAATLFTSSTFQYLDYNMKMLSPVGQISTAAAQTKLVVEEIVSVEETEEVETTAEETEEVETTVEETEEVETAAEETEEVETTAEETEEVETTVEETEAVIEVETEVIEETEAVVEETIPAAEIVTEEIVPTEAVVEVPVVKVEEPVYQPAVLLPDMCDYTYADQRQYNVFRNQIMVRINELRAQVGLGLLGMSDSLTGCADLRSNEVVGMFSHTRPNGSRGIYTVNACQGEYAKAVDYIVSGKSCNYWLGENLAYQYGYDDYAGTDAEIIALADEIFENWKNSPTHYENMVNGHFTMAGVGLNVTMEAGFIRFTTTMLFSNLY